jgi:hypothetical protein
MRSDESSCAIENLVVSEMASQWMMRTEVICCLVTILVENVDEMRHHRQPYV